LAKYLGEGTSRGATEKSVAPLFFEQKRWSSAKRRWQQYLAAPILICDKRNPQLVIALTKTAGN
jgi:hypothetical protein